MELAIETSTGVSSWPPADGAKIHVSLEAAEESIQRRALLYDRDGDYHFDTISAFIKSVRGSDPDAALYWLAKMVRAGEDPKFIFRRMIILASEDVGLADPNAVSVVIACAQAFERIGFPEGNFPLSHACLYLATAPKSNTTLAYFDALKEVEREDAEVPNHLRDASRDAEGFGHGEGYVYPHAYRDHWAAQQYLPTTLRGRTFYIPSGVGYEGKIRDEILRKRELQAAIVLGDGAEGGGELLSWSAAAKGREGWFKRLESGRSALLLNDRNAIFEAACVKRQDRVLIPLANDGLLLWESLRRCPEGLTAAVVNSSAASEALLQYTTALDEAEKPLIIVSKEILPQAKECDENFGCSQFDRILLRAPRLTVELSAIASAVKPLLAKDGFLVLLTSPPVLGERLSRILSEECGEKELAASLRQAEDAFFQNTQGAEFFDTGELETAFKENGFTIKLETLDRHEERLITEKDLSAWFDTGQSRWGSFMAKTLKNDEFQAIEQALRLRTAKDPILWRWKSVLLKAGTGD
jgi:putative ATPase